MKSQMCAINLIVKKYLPPFRNIAGVNLPMCCPGGAVLIRSIFYHRTTSGTFPRGGYSLTEFHRYRL